MNPKITIKTDEIGCRKPKCKHRLEIPHRHHRKCETLFIHSWKRVRRTRSKWYRQLRDGYKEFREEDTVVLCPWHHAEIHVIYDDIIYNFCSKIKKHMRGFSVEQAEQLMAELERACRTWEKEETPGVHPDSVFIPDTPRIQRIAERRKKNVRKKGPRR